MNPASTPTSLADILRRVLLAACLLGATHTGFARNVRVIDFGSDLGWGELTYRGKPSERALAGTVDRDGDGSMTDEFISCWPFSLDTPLNPPGLRYDTDQKNTVFFGGLTLYSSNPAKPEKPRSISEGHLNANHEFRDDFNFMGGLEDHGASELVESYGVWFWQKKDFLNSGDRRLVSFDANSLIAVHVSRYWCGFHAGRWMVRDGTQFYLSKNTWADSYRAFGLETKGEDNPVSHTTHILNPLLTEWAAYNPQAPYRIDFDHATADFKTHAFSNVTAVGFFVNRDASPATKVAGGLRPPFALKWNAFRCDAVVDRKEEDQLVAQVSVPGTDGAPAFYMGKGEVTFRQWEKVWRISVGNQSCPGLGDLGYTFDRDGAMGSMRADEAAHTPNEPVTDITLTDAAAFCNALSEFEGLAPAYYADAAYAKPLRRTVDRDMRENWYKHAPVYWKKDAEGYRLPTAGEWAFAAGEGKEKPLDPGQPSGWTKATSGGRTHEAASSKPNALGVCDLQGNVWEYVWPDAESLDFDQAAALPVYGGSFLYPDDPKAGSLTPFIERPWLGHYALGFRVVRNARKVYVPITSKTQAPRWLIEKDQAISPLQPMSSEKLAATLKKSLALVSVQAGLANEREEMDPDVVKEKNKNVALAQNNRFLKKISDEEAAALIKANTIDVQRTPYPLGIGKTEIPYSLWKSVKGWAEEHGYRFNYAGDMGSMRHNTEANYSYRQTEPVTGLSWYDAIVWCNAASEILGRTPVYYADPERTVPYKTALWLRLDMFADQGSLNLPWTTVRQKGTRIHTGSGDRLYLKVAADGYRLPLDIEFAAANQQPGAEELSEEWTAANAGDKTHPVGEKAGYAQGLCDMNGNVLEWSWDSEQVYFEAQNASYNINGNGYFYEQYAQTKPRSPVKPWSFTEFTATARSFVGFRVASSRID